MFESRRTSLVILTVALALTTLGADALFSQGRPLAGNRRTVMLDGREVVEGEVIVRYRTQSGRIERERAEFQADSNESEAIGRGGARRLRSGNRTTRQLLATLRDNPDVEFAEPNFIIRASATPNDPSMGSLWGLLNTGQIVDGNAGVPGADIGAVAAWDVTTGSRANVIAILDTGIDFNHPDLAANVFTAPRQFSVTLGSATVTCQAGSHGFNALNNSCLPTDDNGHGTHVAGIAGAVGNNNVGVTGVNWTATLMAIKVLDADGAGTTSDAIKALDFVIKAKAALGGDANVRVVNASWGGSNFSEALTLEIEAANSADILFVASAGSDGSNNDVVPHYPASLAASNILSVAAVDNTGVLAPFSNYGATKVHLAAPGASIFSTFPNNDYGYLSGTSMAAPYVSGAAALVLSSCGLTTAQLKTALLATVDPVAALASITVTGGRLNVDRAVRACLAGVTADSVTPNAGSGTSQTFALQYSDATGAANLTLAYVWFQATASNPNSCKAYYHPPSGRLHLLNDAATVWLSAPIGSTGTLANSACAIALGTSTAVASGTTLTLTLPVTFTPAFAGTKNISMFAANGAGVNSGDWQSRGTWTVGATPTTPTTATVTWAAPGGITFGTPLGATQLNATANVPGAFVYSPPAGTVLGAGAGQVLSVTFVPTDTTSYAPVTATVPITVARATPVVTWAAPATVTVGTLLSATQLNAMVAGIAGTLVYTPPAGTALGLGSHTLAVTFTPANAGNYTTASSTVPLTVVATAPPATAVSVDSVTPNAGSGASQTFVLQYSDVTGATNLTLAYVWFHVTASNPNSCKAYYHLPSGRLHLLNDAATVWLSAPIGSTGTLANSACAIALGTSTAVPNGTTLTLTLPVTFTPAFAGTKNISMFAANGAGVNSGDWQSRGTWTVGATPTTPTTPTVTWAAPGGITFGTPLGATQLNATANVPGAFVYSPPAGTVLGAGAGQVLSVTFVPTDTTSYAPVTATVPITVARATPVVTWAAPATVTVGTLLSATQLNAMVAGIAGTLVYTPPAGTALGLGSHTLAVTFTPANAGNYTTASSTVPLTVVATAPPATAVSGDSVTPNAGSGASQTFVLQYSDVTGATNLTLAYVWFHATASNPNSCKAYYHPPSGRLHLLNDAATVWLSAAIGSTGTLANSACAIALGTSTAVPNGTTLTLTLPVTFTPAFAGTKNISMFAANGAGVNSGDWQSRGTWTVGATPTTPTTATVTWAAPGGITFGTPLGATQLNATANVAGAFVYSPPAGTVLGAGAGQVLSVTFVPTDTTSYAPVTATVPITVARATPVVTWAAPATVTVGTLLSATQLNAMVAGIAGTLVYTPPAGTALGLGSHTLAVTFTPANAGNYTTASSTVPLTVVATAPPATAVSGDSVTPNAGSGASQTFVLQYSDVTGATNLTLAYVWFHATASNPNSCKAYYHPPSGRLHLLNDAATVWLSAAIGSTGTLANSACAIALGTSTAVPNGTTLTLTLPVTFTPAFAGTKNISMFAANGAGVNSGDWQSRGTWTVGATPTTPTTATVTWAAPGGITFGTPLGATQLNATANVAGAFVYSPPAGTVLGAGAGQVLSVTFVPTDTTSYAPVTATVPITVARATPVVTWAAPATVTVGTLLSATQLNAMVAGIAGTLVYTPPAGTALGLGSHTLAVTFTPANAGNYTTASSTVPLTVVATAPPATATAVSVDSVTPNAGSGTSQTFVLQYSDVTGATNLTLAYVWFQATASNPSSCKAYYHPPSGRLHLLNDAATVWLSAPIGSTGTLANSACAIALGTSTAVASGTTLTLTLPVTFTPGSSGAQDISMFAANSAGVTNGSWQNRGGWSVP